MHPKDALLSFKEYNCAVIPFLFVLAMYLIVVGIWLIKEYESINYNLIEFLFAAFYIVIRNWIHENIHDVTYRRAGATEVDTKWGLYGGYSYCLSEIKCGDYIKALYYPALVSIPIFILGAFNNSVILLLLGLIIVSSSVGDFTAILLIKSKGIQSDELVISVKGYLGCKYIE